jgi:hypothetical protein
MRIYRDMDLVEQLGNGLPKIKGNPKPATFTLNFNLRTLNT